MIKETAKKRKKEDPKKVYERLKKYRQNTKTEKFEIIGLDPKIKDQFLTLKGLEKLTNAIKLKKLIESWNGKSEILILKEAEEIGNLQEPTPVNKAMKEDEFNLIIKEIVLLQFKIKELESQKKNRDKLFAPENEQFSLFIKNLKKKKKNVRYETIEAPEVIHNQFQAQIIKQIDIDVETVLGKERGITYFILISKITEPEDVVSYSDSSLDSTMKYFNKMKFSKKHAKDKFEFLSGKWKSS